VTIRPDRSSITVVKLGGSTLGAHDTSLADIAAAHRTGSKIVVVHGGGAKVSDSLARDGIEPKFVRGLRVTDAATLDVVVGVLAGSVNTRLVAQLTALGVQAAGLTGADGSMLYAERYDDALGFVGRITAVDTRLIATLLDGGYLPVIAPIGVESGATQLLNTNADTAAGEIARALGAQRLIFLTDVSGVLDAEGRVIERLTAADAHALIDSRVAAGGMIPKLEAAIRAASGRCSTLIIDGTVEGTLARALAGEVIGTTITA
jgi:acetylglutamate kinase